MHCPPVLEGHTGLQSPALPDIVLQGLALALPAVLPSLQAGACGVQAGAQPRSLGHYQGALGERREPEDKNYQAGCCSAHLMVLQSPQAWVFLAPVQVSWLQTGWPGSDQESTRAAVLITA